MKPLDQGIDLNRVFPTAWHQDATPTAKLRVLDDDFQVDEQLQLQSEDAGDHLYLQIRKRGQNTLWVVEKLAEACAIPVAEIGFAGMKDRHAVTSQWISIPLRSALQRESLPELCDVEILAQRCQPKKLRRGDHQANRFVLRLRDVELRQELMEARLVAIQRQGVPNYFGEQRFGRDRQNVPRAASLLASRRLGTHPKKSIYLSALRSWVFNHVLAARVQDGSWLSSEVETGPLWGRGRLPVNDVMVAYEQDCLVTLKSVCDLLEHAGLQQERRVLCLMPQAFRWEWEAENALRLEFTLSAGAFATSIVREIALTHSHRE